MATEPARFRPPPYPPPEFPPRRPAVFARTPPAIFPPLLGLLGLALALRAGFARLGWPQAVPDLAAGVALSLWAFGVLAYAAKLARRPGVIRDDLKAMPSRAGLAAATMGAMAAAALLAPFAPGVGRGLLAAALLLHGALALLVLRLILTGPAEGRAVSPVWHLLFVGQVVGAMAAAGLGWPRLAAAVFWPALAAAAAIWAASLAQLRRRPPPPPLRPLLAIHLAPASVAAAAAAGLGMTGLALALGALAAAVLVMLLLSLRWLTAAGFSPLWGAFTFPLAAAAGALLRLGGVWADAGLVVLTLAVLAVPAIAWGVLRLWPQGRLAALTNAAQA